MTVEQALNLLGQEHNGKIIQISNPLAIGGIIEMIQLKKFTLLTNIFL